MLQFLSLAVPSPEECLVETVGAAEVVGKASTENGMLPIERYL